MGFLNGLFGRCRRSTEHYNRGTTGEGATGIEAELRVLCGENSHPEHPLLLAGYAPASRYPAVDFTPWIATKLAEQHFEDIAYLLTQLTLANPGLGIGSEYWGKEALKLCRLDLHKAIECGDNKAFLDLHAALFPYILHGSLDGFMLVDHIDFLARVMSPYAFSVLHLETKVKAANQFIRKMREETREQSTAWTEYPLLYGEDFKDILDSEPPAPGIRAKLREVSTGARQLFFGTLKDGPGQGHWIARPYGIDEIRARAELVESELGELQDDPSLVLMTYRKEELLAALEGHSVKQGWNKKYIAKYMKENAPEVAAGLTAGKRIFKLREDAREEGKALANRIDETKVLLALALGFVE